MSPPPYVRWFETLSMADVPSVGGKNASLGELVRHLGAAGVRVPDGFATTAEAYRDYVAANRLGSELRSLLGSIERRRDPTPFGARIRSLFERGEIPDDMATEIADAYRELGRRCGRDDVDVAVRSSATAEDLPAASFAGQQESYLNVVGESQLLDSVKRCFASLFTDRAIAYRAEHRFDHVRVALSVGVQKMVRSDRASAGVMFTIDTESGFPGVVRIEGAWGLGEYVVKGRVIPDSFVVFKPLLASGRCVPILERTLGSKTERLVYADGGSTSSVVTTDAERKAFVLTDDEVLELARLGRSIEDHYGRPMDIEWAKDADSGDMFVVQARPETVQSRRGGSLVNYKLRGGSAKRLVSGLAVGEGIATGRAVRIDDPSRFGRFVDGDVLVTRMTDPDWGPIMRRAAGIVTDEGGRTCHAAIVAREYGIPAAVGTLWATTAIEDGADVTLSCAEGETASVYEGILPFDMEEVDLSEVPSTKTRIMLNIASPELAFHWWRLPVEGIGLARMEFIVTNTIKVHPLALTRFDQLIDPETKRRIQELTASYEDRGEYFVDGLASGIARIAASRYPDPVLVRTSDFKTNEYAGLIGGRQFEPVEANPMIGFRGASRYYSDRYRDGFELECRAIKRVREVMGFSNVVVMIPFCRTLEEADRVLETLASFGLERGRDGLEVYVMAEIPSNVVLAEGFATRFDGFSIGSNDLTQLVLGTDRDSAELAPLFDERNDAVTRMISDLIRRAHAAGAKVGICGQAPSDYPEFAEFLVGEGIDSISLNPDSVVRTKQRIARLERGLRAA